MVLAPPEVGLQAHLSDHLAVDVPKRWAATGEVNSTVSSVVVRNDQIQIMRVPRCDPAVGQIPRLVYCHRTPLEDSIFELILPIGGQNADLPRAAGQCIVGAGKGPESLLGLGCMLRVRQRYSAGGECARI